MDRNIFEKEDPKRNNNRKKTGSGSSILSTIIAIIISIGVVWCLIANEFSGIGALIIILLIIFLKKNRMYKAMFICGLIITIPFLLRYCSSSHHSNPTTSVQQTETPSEKSSLPVESPKVNSYMEAIEYTRRLYELIKNEYSDVGDFSSFNTEMAYAEKRGELYSRLRKDGYTHLGNFAEFEAKLGYSPSTEIPTTTLNSSSTPKKSSYSSQKQEAPNPYINNRLETGELPYSHYNTAWGDESEIFVKTKTSGSDVVVLLKQYSEIVRNVYIRAGGSYSFHIPNGSYQVFFYYGKGWNPEKRMNDRLTGGFVTNESFQKDAEIFLDNQKLTYELIPQRNGNFNTQQSSASEMF